ncbi:coiled-coil domain-containing protein 9B [Rhipicephalus sanguineus]|uniref:coiled-coil domain-containing protein 9B n=1 Tax=Rhipicephalus sanguineus TaxID=34632 RepID=UPI0020C347A5|nr:coiled-coil domain-containing protein 9B [Rhipicephalus sanguineus]
MVTALAESSSSPQDSAEKKPPKPREPRVRPLPPPVERDSLTHRMQRLSTEDGPPPDPNYRFLADRMREGDADGGGDRGGSRRHRDNYGGQDFDNVRHAMRQDKALQRESGHVLPPKLAMTGRQRREYEQWKSDRAAIDQERMQRHTDAEGNFTREWDLHKELGPPSPQTERRALQGGFSSGSRIYMRGCSRGRGEGGRQSFLQSTAGGRGSPGDTDFGGDECFRGKTRHRGSSAGKSALDGQDVSHRRGSRQNQRRHSARSDVSEGSTSDDGTHQLPPLLAGGTTESDPTRDTGEPAAAAETTEPKSDDLWEN